MGREGEGEKERRGGRGGERSGKRWLRVRSLFFRKEKGEGGEKEEREKVRLREETVKKIFEELRNFFKVEEWKNNEEIMKKKNISSSF